MGPGTVPKFPSGSQALGTGNILKSLAFHARFPGSQPFARAYDTRARVTRERLIYWELWEPKDNIEGGQWVSGSRRGSQAPAVLGTWEPAFLRCELLGAGASVRAKIDPFRGLGEGRGGATFRGFPLQLGADRPGARQLDPGAGQAGADRAKSEAYRVPGVPFGTVCSEPKRQGIVSSCFSGLRCQLRRLPPGLDLATIAARPGGSPPAARARSAGPWRSRFLAIGPWPTPVRLPPTRSNRAKIWGRNRGSGGAWGQAGRNPTHPTGSGVIRDPGGRRLGRNGNQAGGDRYVNG